MTETKPKLEPTQESNNACLMLLWQVLVTGPIWMVLLYQILLALGDTIPQWTWVLYWIYVPSFVAGTVLSGWAKMLMSAKKTK